MTVRVEHCDRCLTGMEWWVLEGKRGKENRKENEDNNDFLGKRWWQGVWEEFSLHSTVTHSRRTCIKVWGNSFTRSHISPSGGNVVGVLELEKTAGHSRFFLIQLSPSSRTTGTFMIRSPDKTRDMYDPICAGLLLCSFGGGHGSTPKHHQRQQKLPV